jgi:hypothetical protein
MATIEAFSLAQLPRWSAADVRTAPLRARWFARVVQPVSDAWTQLTKASIALSLSLEPPRQHQLDCGGKDDGEFVFIGVRQGNAVRALLRMRTLWLSQMTLCLLPMVSRTGVGRAPSPPTSVERSIAGLLAAVAIHAVAPHSTLQISLSATDIANATSMSWFASVNIDSDIASDACDVFVSPHAMTALAKVDRHEPPNDWPIASYIALGTCRLSTQALERLGLRDVVTLDAVNDWCVGNAVIAVTLNHLTAPTHATVLMGYIPSVKPALPATTTIEFTATVGVHAMPLGHLTRLAVGDVIELRQSVHAVDLRVDGHVIGQGELLNVDGELAVRVVSLRP